MRPPPPLRLQPNRRLQLIGSILATLFLLAAACLAAVGLDDRYFRQQRDRSLKQLARQTALLIFLRAAELLGRHRYDRTQGEHGRTRRRQQILRAIVGVHLRRALSHRDPLTRIGLLFKAFAQIETHARALQHRLRHGLTRAWGLASAPEVAEALPALHAGARVITDSS